jgi:hypothetical protein
MDTPLSAVASFYASPGSMLDPRITEIPLQTPLHAHFGAECDQEMVTLMESKWKEVIERQGGIHSHGLHSMEDHVFRYNAKVFES